MKDSYCYYTDKLEGKYKSTFCDIETYGWTVDMDSILYEEKMSELLDVFISAQEEKKEIDTIVGNDINSFCENFFSEVPKISKIKELFDAIKQMAWILVVVDSLVLLLEMGEEEKATSDIGGIIFIFGCTYIISRLVAIVSRKFLYSRLKIKYKTRRALVLATQLVCSVIILAVAFVNFQNIIVIPSYVEGGIAAAYLVIYYIFNHKRLKKDKMERGKADIIEEIDISDEMNKKFERKNKKLTKKGKAPLTIDEFVKKEEKSTDRILIINKMYFIFPVFVTLIAFAITYFTDGFESIMDMGVFCIIMLGVEYLIIIPFYKLETKIYAMRKKWQNKYYQNKNE